MSSKQEKYLTLTKNFFSIQPTTCQHLLKLSNEVSALVSQFDRKQPREETFSANSLDEFYQDEALSSLGNPSVFKTTEILANQYSSLKYNTPEMYEFIPHLIRAFLRFIYYSKTLLVTDLDTILPFFKLLPSVFTIFTKVSNSLVNDVTEFFEYFFDSMSEVLPKLITKKEANEIIEITASLCGNTLVFFYTREGDSDYILTPIIKILCLFIDQDLHGPQFITSYSLLLSFIVNKKRNFKKDLELYDKVMEFIINNLDGNQYQLAMQAFIGLLPFPETPTVAKILDSLISKIFGICEFHVLCDEIPIPEFSQPQVRFGEFIEQPLVDETIVDNPEIYFKPYNLSSKHRQIADFIVKAYRNEPLLLETFIVHSYNITTHYTDFIGFFCTVLLGIGAVNLQHFANKSLIAFILHPHNFFMDSFTLCADLIIEIVIHHKNLISITAHILHDLIETKHPFIVNQIFVIFAKLSLKSPGSQLLYQLPIIDSIIQTDDLIRQNIGNPIMMETHSRIVGYFSKILNKKQSNTIMFEDQARTAYVFTFLFEPISNEHAIKWINTTLKTTRTPTSLILSLLTFFRILLKSQNKEKGLNLVIRLIDCIINALDVNTANISQALAESKALYALTALCSDFPSSKFYSELLQVFKQVQTLRLPQSTEAFNKALSLSNKITLDEEIYQRIIDLIAYEQSEIVNPEMVVSAYNWFVQTPFITAYLEFLNKLTDSNRSNKFQVYKVGLLTRIFEYIVQTNGNEPSAINLLYSVGSHFFYKKELISALHLIKESESSNSMLILTIMDTILSMSDQVLPTNVMHFFAGSEGIYAKRLNIEEPIEINFHVCFPKDCNSGEFLMITTETTILIIEIKDNKALLRIIQDTDISEAVIDKLEYEKWEFFQLMIAGNLVVLKIDPYYQKLSLLNNFGVIKSMHIKNIKCDITSVEIINPKTTEVIYSFSTLRIQGSTFVSNGDIEATFVGNLINTSPTFMNAVVSSGGPRIFLPLFKAIPQGQIGEKFLERLMSFLATVFKRNETLFHKQQFFKVLAALIDEIDPSYINGAFSKSITNIYESTKSDLVKDELVEHIFSNFDIVCKLKGIFPGFYREHPEIFKKYNFTQILSFLCSTNFQDLPQDAEYTDIVFILQANAPQIIDKEQASLLVTLSLTSNGTILREAFLIFLYRRLLNKDLIILAEMVPFHFFIYPTIFLSLDSLILHTTALKLFRLIKDLINPANFENSKCYIPKAYPQTDPIILEQSIDSLMETIFLDIQSVVPITFFELIPLLLDTISKIKQPMVYIDYLRLSVEQFGYNSPDPNWIILLAFLAQYYDPKSIITSFKNNFTDPSHYFMVAALLGIQAYEVYQVFYGDPILAFKTCLISVKPLVHDKTYQSIRNSISQLHLSFDTFTTGQIEFAQNCLEKLCSDDFQLVTEVYVLFKDLLPSEYDELNQAYATFCENKEKLKNVEDLVIRITHLKEQLTREINVNQDLTAYIQSQNNLVEDFEEIMAEHKRITRLDHKEMVRLFEDLRGEYGGPWSDTNFDNHRKIDFYYDDYGRHMRTKRNPHFDNHKEIKQASKPIIHVKNNGNCYLVKPSSIFSGSIYVTPNSVIFESRSATDPISEITSEVQRIFEILLEEVNCYTLKRYKLHDKAIELYTKKKSYFLVLGSKNDRNLFLKTVKSSKKWKASPIPLKKLTKAWVRRKISNYEYIFWLNMASGRSFNDLSQYPVFPWILKNYSEPLDLTDENQFRDLSKPIGALNEERLSILTNQKQELHEEDHPSLYNLHYSNPSYVIHFLIRCEPFTSLHLSLQTNKFDDPNRLFYSIPSTWRDVTSKTMDFRELIPEFYSFPDFLLNFESFDFGILRDGVTRVDDILLPPYSKNATEFVFMNRLALESDYVSQNLNKWIDLMFGYKQRGEAAEEYFNDYPFASYYECLELDPDNAAAYSEYAANFGICPDQLFKEPHPQREVSRIFPFSSLTHPIDIVAQTLPIQTPNEAIKAFYSSGTIIWVDNMGQINTFKREFSFIKTAIGFNYKSDFNFTNFIAYSHKTNIISITNPWVNYFEVYSLDKRQLMSRVRYNDCLSCLAIGEDMHYVGQFNSSVTFVTKTGERHYVLGHNEEIASVCIDQRMNIALSIDRSGLLLMTSVTSGKVINCFTLRVNPLMLFLTEMGLIAAVFKDSVNNSAGAAIVVIDLGGRKMAEAVVESVITAACVCKLPDYNEILFVATEDKVVTLYRMIDLKVLLQKKLQSAATAVCYNPDEMAVIAFLKNSETMSVQLKFE